MRTETSPAIYLKDYRAPAFVIDHVSLDFRLDPDKTLVISRLDFRPIAENGGDTEPLVLDGTGIHLLKIGILGRELEEDEYTVDPDTLTIHNPPREPFSLEIENTCNPKANTALSGLYLSSGNYCTQCEAEGFRRITYFVDRPDILSRYRVRIEAPADEHPVMLSNGNKVLAGTIDGSDRHFVIWEDPFPKPSYLFALVAGNLACVSEKYETSGGHPVTLEIYVEPGKENRCGWAMDSLKRSMRWDEKAFGREYDLDVFMIVAVPDFNMGAMENKGLNIFNDKYILALPETATDVDYENIESIIAHEYFHNWSGNRVTCRDWFQLCLKEGLTVFRDQEFTSDERSRAVKRIDDVKRLRAHQFPEDAGPLAHPVRPASYLEINNFYTATVYEKGAEVIRMLKTLIGAETFRKGMDLYFARYDGTAATVEDFIGVMAQVSGRDFDHFFQWYEQAGTPHISAEGNYDATNRTFTLQLTQTTPATPGQNNKPPFHIPLRMGLVSTEGAELPLTLEEGEELSSDVLELSKPVQKWKFSGVEEEPVLSLNRDFSAPVRVTAHQSLEEKLVLVARDSDPFNRWEAAQKIGQALITSMMARLKGTSQNDDLADRFASALSHVLSDNDLEPAFKAQMLGLPSYHDMAGLIANDIDPQLVHDGREGARHQLGARLQSQLQAIWKYQSDRDYSPDYESAGKRDLRHASLSLLAAGDNEWGVSAALDMFHSASDMTTTIAALDVLCRLDCSEREEALEAFYKKYRDDHLLVDKWFSLQAMAPFPETLGQVRELMSHDAFNLNRPNTVRALVGVFAMANPVCFHAADGSGYEFVADVIIELDKINPQVAARLTSAFRSLRTLETGRAELAEQALTRIYEAPSLSKDTYEIAEKSLAHKKTK